MHRLNDAMHTAGCIDTPVYLCHLVGYGPEALVKKDCNDIDNG